MRQPLIVFLSLPMLVASLAAQTPPEGIHIYPDTLGSGTSFATRLTFGNAAGEAIVQYPNSHFEGIGDSSTAATGASCSISNLSWVIQDQNQQSAHNLTVALRPEGKDANNKPTGQPDPNNSNAIYRITATSPTATGSGPAAWLLWFQNPINQTVSCKGNLFFGIGFSANSNWPGSDGLSTHAALYDPAAANVQNGDAVAPRKNVPNLTWEIDANGKVSQPTAAQVLDYKLILSVPTIQVGVRHKTGQSNHGSDDGFGVAAMYPSISGGSNGRQDGLLVRITDNPPSAFGGQYLLYLSLTTGTQLNIPPIQLTGITGRIYLGPANQFFLAAGSLSGTTSQTVVQVAPPGSIPTDIATNNVKVFFQAATTRSNAPKPNVFITNLSGVFY